MPESNTSSHSSLPLSAMESQKPSSNLHPLSFLSSFLHQHCSRLGSEISTRLDCAKRFAANAVTFRPKLHPAGSAPFASVLQDTWQPKHVFDIALSTEYVAKTMAGTPVYTVSNSNNEFVLISDPNGAKSLGLLCFRHEDAEALLAQVQLRQPVLGRGARVVPITLDQVYMLKVEGIAFRFLPDPTQIRNALELKAADRTKGFDGVPVFQSDLLVVKKKNKRYCPIYFQKEDIERELSRVSKASRGGLSQHIMVGCLEDVLKKMEMNNKNSGWEDLIFIPPGKSYSQHIKEVAA
ncbi:protein TIC 22, chloroplastic isoform X1 [Magnolia sinica]|uniref:protein TIC 22, chloroplastic isoform X1 n=1 Tax=Magnolia sinica TaxID=86752 RepID=UPI00265B5891|nr:protein TIC 22, chloroplastic isoform X1 [Magnolia sinica]